MKLNNFLKKHKALLRRVFIFSVIIAAACFLQVTFLDLFRLFTVKLDLLFILAVVSGLSFRGLPAVGLSAFCGLCKDIFSANPLGLNIALFMFWCFITLRLCRQISLEDDVARVALISVLALLHCIALGLIFAYSGRNILPGIFLRIILIYPLYTAVVSYFLLKFLKHEQIWFN